MKIINITLFFLVFFKPLIAIESIAKQAIVYDMQTNSIIYEKNADELMSPRSMSKLLTVYYVFKKLNNGERTILGVKVDNSFRIIEDSLNPFRFAYEFIGIS